MMRFVVLLSLFIFTYSYGENISYKFGRGIFVGNTFWIGSYLSLNYWKTSNKNSLNFEDFAVLLKADYGKFRLFTELEAKDIYLLSSVEKNRYWDFKFEIERIFAEYRQSENFNIRIGRFLTPLGIWNKIHIDVLKWTVSDPFVSQHFFPMFTTGLNLFGYLSKSKKIKYQLFIQKNESINSSYNNIKPENMFGVQIEKSFNVNKKIGFNLGRFKDKENKERYLFTGFYGKLKIKKLFLSTEFYYANEKYKGEDKIHKEHGKVSYYIQGIYRLFSKHYFVLRKDGFYDSSDNRHKNAWILCYNYRPLFNISLKAEYQLFEKGRDYIRFSFSMLF